MKSIFNVEDAEDLINRSRSVTSDSKALWGNMNASEMFYHCNFTNKQILEGEMEKTKNTFKQNFKKTIALYFINHFPKNIKGLKRNDAKGKVSTEEFEKVKGEFPNIIRKFSRHNNEISVMHPAFGNLSNREWGISTWKHIDHHLRQFGV